MNDHVLLDTPLITITALDGVARATVENRSDVGAAEGAEIARRMVDTVTREVFGSSARCQGLVLDVRNAPDVFGPKTRDALETLFRASEAAKKRIGVLVRSTTQRLQYDSLTGLYAPSTSRLFDSLEEAAAFARGAG